MLAAPHNDRACLDNLTAYLAGQLDRAELRELAARFDSTRALAQWIRSLPQHDDTGDPSEVPRVACDSPQRVQLPSEHPNCVERALLYIALAEQLDPRPARQLATTLTERGRHTFPTEDGKPIVLDPLQSQNALAAGLWRNAAAPARPTRDERTELRWLFSWVLKIAEEPAYATDGDAGVRQVHLTRRLFGELGLVQYAPRRKGRRIPDAVAQSAIAYTLARAHQGAEPWGREGAESVQLASDTLHQLGLLGCSGRACCSSCRDRADYRNVSEAGKKAGRTVLGIGHAVGGSVLRLFGLGSIADSVGEVYEREGLLPASSAPSSAASSSSSATSSSTPTATLQLTATATAPQSTPSPSGRGSLVMFSDL